MADPRGFITTAREVPQRRAIAERINDWNEVYPGTVGRAVLPIIEKQASRCMDCGIPFCNNGCPLGNLIPEWNDLVWRGKWQEALERLHATNNFPELTGRLCPAPCETSCVVGISRDPVTIKNVEVAIIDKAWDDLRVVPQQPEWHTSKTVAVVGSGPAGLAVAQQLTRAGHTVVVYERADEIGGLLRYGIPEFKLEKSVLDRRLKQMVLEGTQFKTNVEIGVDITIEELRDMYEAVVLAIGATIPRGMDVPGANLRGIHQAMEYLPQANKAARGVEVPDQISAAGKNVVIIGGGDTGADCLGTAIRQGAASITQLEIMPMPSTERPAHQPWPTYPMTFKVASAHEEGGDRVYAVNTVAFTDDGTGAVSGLDIVEVEFQGGQFVPVPGTERHLEAELVLLAMGFLGPQKSGIIDELGLELDARGNIVRNEDYVTSVPGVFACGDAGRGQSLIVWAIAEGRSCAHGVDQFLSGTSKLPRPISPQLRQLML
ncbi:glutamate synthase (NADPH/NADH) small chain [Arcanobacterium pluranimalium]|uniref:glutamate synthase small subunit n=1 Tax=Arcanobacterium pluranimalium TaxID=108028 RepID=UPI00195D7C16|nr:glutamate synthase (NADPH/NADH) small chain [Arcanobacterium pluranimalium]